jgi:hypothetical protein
MPRVANYVKGLYFAVCRLYLQETGRKTNHDPSRNLTPCILGVRVTLVGYSYVQVHVGSADWNNQALEHDGIHSLITRNHYPLVFIYSRPTYTVSTGTIYHALYVYLYSPQTVANKEKKKKS